MKAYITRAKTDILNFDKKQILQKVKILCFPPPLISRSYPCLALHVVSSHVCM